MKKLKFYFRLNSDKKMGIGHLMRTYRLAKKLQKKGHTCIFCLDDKIKFENIIQNFKVIYLYKKNFFFKNEILDAQLFLKIVDIPNQIVIVDDYRLSHIWEKEIKKNKHKIIAFDDLEDRKHYSDIYINYRPNFSKNNNFNQDLILNKNCKTLIGPKYSVIDCNTKINEKLKSKIFKICFYMGGSGNLIEIYKIIKELIISKFGNLKNIQFFVVAGPYVQNLNLIRKLSNKFKFVKVVAGKKNLDKLISEVNLIVGSAGNIVYEASYYNIPCLFFEMAKNQTNNIFSMQKIGHYFVLPKNSLYSFKKISYLIYLIFIHYERIKKLSRTKELKIDNRGVQRIINSIFSFDDKNKNLKKNKILDISKNTNKSFDYKIFQVNDKEINYYLFARNLIINREVSTNKKIISSLDHYIWWLTTKRNSFCLIKNNKKILFLYDETIKFNLKNYSLQGWFLISKQCNLQDILYALNWQKKYINKKKNIDLSIGMIKKKNKINFSRYLGWKLVNQRSKTSKILKQIYNVRNNYLFYER